MTRRRGGRTVRDVEHLKYLAEKQGITATAALRRAIATEHLIHVAIEEGDKILIEQPDKSIRELWLR